MDNMLSEILEIMRQPLDDIRVAGFIHDDSKSLTFHPDLSKIYFQFDSIYVEVRRTEGFGEDVKLKITTVDNLSYPIEPGDEGVAGASTSILETILPESWTYAVSKVRCYYDSGNDLKAGILECMSTEIYHSNKIFLTTPFNRNSLFLHPFTSYGIRIGNDQDRLFVEQERQREGRGFSVYEWPQREEQ